MSQKIRLEGLTLTVKDVRKSIAYYKKIGFVCQVNAAPHFALLRIGGPSGGTLGLLALSVARREGVRPATKAQKLAIHVELSTDNLDELHKTLVRKGIKFHTPPHDEPWERSATALDPDGYPVEIAEGRRGKPRKKPR